MEVTYFIPGIKRMVENDLLESGESFTEITKIKALVDCAGDFAGIEVTVK